MGGIALEWRAVAGFPDYEVSNLGDVRRVTPQANTYPGKVLAKITDADGYFRVNLHLGGKSKLAPVHRLVCIAFHGPQPTSQHSCVGHYNGDRTDNRSTNLRWVTHQENSDDMRLHGTVLSGERHPKRARPETCARGSANGNARATEEQVRAIRQSTKTNAEISRETGLSPSIISRVRLGKAWRHVA